MKLAVCVLFGGDAKPMPLECYDRLGNAREHAASLSDITLVGVPPHYPRKSLDPKKEVVMMPENVGNPPNIYARRCQLAMRAAEHGCDWILFLDDDEGLRETTPRGDLEELAKDALYTGVVGYSVRVRDLWRGSTHYRSDGLWGKKTAARFVRNPIMWGGLLWSDDIVHPCPVPTGRIGESHLELLHFGVCTPQLLQVRVSKHNRWDPEKRFQPIGYDYMLDEAGLAVAPI